MSVWAVKWENRGDGEGKEECEGGDEAKGGRCVRVQE